MLVAALAALGVTARTKVVPVRRGPEQLQVILSADLPEDGYRQLFDLDLSHFTGGPLRYDQLQRRWCPAPDGAGNA